MKITKQNLRTIIKEELSNLLEAGPGDGELDDSEAELLSKLVGDAIEDSEDDDEFHRDFDPHYEQETERTSRAEDYAERAQEKKKFFELPAVSDFREALLDEFVFFLDERGLPVDEGEAGKRDPLEVSIVEEELTAFYDRISRNLGYESD